ncbi:MAG: ATP-binding cassette domain-containing protein [Paracoccus sp. (in: a-proteobacteria)]|uniref:ATP-binding cassette domain-containing protein n=1 Tax=Paracoccus sp. TaxID=267 RepID=UPI0039E6A1EA
MLLDVRNIAKDFGSTSIFGKRAVGFQAVADVSFGLEQGRTLGVIGESGAGKSTVGRMIARLIEPSAGQIIFRDRNLLALSRADMRAMRAHLQMIFQDPYSSFDPLMTVGASIAEPLLIHKGQRRSEAWPRVIELLERVGMGEEHANRYPRELSGGQLQRAAIARALTTTPALIICDEPVAALDVLVRAQVLELMRDIQKDFGVSYLFITHDLSLLKVVAHDVCVMQRGRVVELADVDSILNRPREDYTRSLLRAIPRLPARGSRDAGRAGTILHLPVGGPAAEGKSAQRGKGQESGKGYSGNGTA